MGVCECEAVIGFDYGLGQGASRDFRACVCSGEQCAIFRESSTQASGDVEVAGDVDEYVCNTDAVCGDETRRAWFAEWEAARG